MKKITLTEIADRINTYLCKFEADPKINKVNILYGTKPYFYTMANRQGSRVFITYVSYQGDDSLSRARAEVYLTWLDAGNIGRHWEMEKKHTEEVRTDGN